MRGIVAFLFTALIVTYAASTRIDPLKRLVPRAMFQEGKIPVWNAKNPTKMPNIVGGEPTEIREFPHQLSLRVYGYHICGASVSYIVQLVILVI